MINYKYTVSLIYRMGGPYWENIFPVYDLPGGGITIRLPQRRHPSSTLSSNFRLAQRPVHMGDFRCDFCRRVME